MADLRTKTSSGFNSRDRFHIKKEIESDFCHTGTTIYKSVIQFDNIKIEEVTYSDNEENTALKNKVNSNVTKTITDDIENNITSDADEVITPDFISEMALESSRLSSENEDMLDAVRVKNVNLESKGFPHVNGKRILDTDRKDLTFINTSNVSKAANYSSEEIANFARKNTSDSRNVIHIKSEEMSDIDGYELSDTEREANLNLESIESLHVNRKRILDTDGVKLVCMNTSDESEVADFSSEENADFARENVFESENSTHIKSEEMSDIDGYESSDTDREEATDSETGKTSDIDMEKMTYITVCNVNQEVGFPSQVKANLGRKANYTHVKSGDAPYMDRETADIDRQQMTVSDWERRLYFGLQENEEITSVHGRDDSEVKTKFNCERTFDGTTGRKTTTESANDEQRKYKCCMCNKRFKLKQHLDQHILTHTYARAKLLKTHECLTCSKKFKMKHHLERHILTHTKEKQFKCAICDKSYVVKHDLQKHMNKHLVKPTDFACDVCGRAFETKFKLQRHRVSHNLTCGICLKVFAARKYLRYHLRMHTKMTPFTCEICDKAFPFKALLIEHNRKHTGEKPFECEVCKRTFSTKSNKLRHMRSHFHTRKCRHCHGEFPDKDQFQLHLKTCSSKYKCSKCGWVFKSSSNLKRHLSIHAKYLSPPTNVSQDSNLKPEYIKVEMVS